MFNLFMQAIYYSLYVLEMILFLRVILSWFGLRDNHPLIQIVYSLTEPMLSPIRILIDKSIFGGRKGGALLDISPLIAFIFLQVMQNYIQQFLII